MAEQPSSFQFEDVPLDEARRMSRGPRMDPQLYQELRTRIQSLSDQAVRMTITNGTSQNTMKNRILRVAAELGIPVTIRRVPGGVIFWRSSAENIEQAQEAANRLHTGRQTGKTTQPRPQARSRGRRPRGVR
jgi:precorrin-4 methylase